MSPATPGMSLSIDVSQYFHLPPDVRVRFDGWLKTEDLNDKMIVELTLSEGEVVVTRIADPVEVVDDEPVRYETRYPVRSLPPLEAFHRAPSVNSAGLVE